MESSHTETKGGYITKEFTVECATCANLDTFFVDSFDAAEKMARFHGWSETQQFGWICGDCVQRRKNGEVLKLWEYKEPEEEIRGDSSVGRAGD